MGVKDNRPLFLNIRLLLLLFLFSNCRGDNVLEGGGRRD